MPFYPLSQCHYGAFGYILKPGDKMKYYEYVLYELPGAVDERTSRASSHNNR